MLRYADNRAIILSSGLDFVPHLAGLPVPKTYESCIVTTRNQATVWADRQINHIPTRVVPSESFLPVLPELVSCSIYHDLVIHRLECDILSTWMRRRTSQRVHARVRNEFDRHQKVVFSASQAVRQDQTLGAIRHPLYPPGGPTKVLALVMVAVRMFVRAYVCIVQLGRSQVASGGKTASGGKVGPVYIYRHPLLLR
jgi:hypothetical protein